MTKFTVSLALCLVALMGNALAAPSASKVSLALQKTLQTKSRVNIFVSFNEGTDGVLAQINNGVYTNSGEKATVMYNALNAHAAQTQKNVLALLNSPRFFVTKVQSFWISNQVFVQGADQSVIAALATMPEVSIIEEEAIVYLDEPAVADAEPGVLAEWGVDKIQSQEAWAVAGDGAGAIVGVIDTGARHTHNAISGSYRGGTHSWYNPYTQTAQPGDGHGHGTHCTGTIAGNQGLGVAPGAKWISCKGLQDNGSGSQAALLACGEFMTCPHTATGGSPDCSLKPDAVSNSWGGGAGANWYDPVINAWKAALIIPVFAQGNSGSACRTANSPGDSAAGCIGVGATTSTDAIASFSSRGPSNFNQQKPDVSAPGNQIVSAGHLSDTARATMSGTSMACPHVAGLVGLLKSRNKNATYDTIKQILQDTTDRNLPSSGQTCDGVADTVFPNYTFGYGRINALKAVQANK